MAGYFIDCSRGSIKVFGAAMMNRIGNAFNTILAISAGTIVLLGTFIPIPALAGFRILLVDWAVLLAGVAVLIGIFNLFTTHTKKIRKREPGSIYSLVLLVFMLIALILGIVPALEPLQNVMLNGILIPVEVSLMAVLSVTLVVASMRLLRQRLELSSIVFIATALFILMGLAPWPYIGYLPIISDLRSYIAQVLAAGGARGILIGVSSGILTTGLRILLGADRPFGGK